jgi:RNA polymerase sigma-70 factor (ECF subfamily)
VLQEAFLQAAQAWPKYLERPEQPVFLWLRWLTGMTLQLLHRQHLGVQARDAGREVQLLDRPWPEATSAALAAQLLGRDTRPSVAAIRAERQRRLQEALNTMDPVDREVLILRHFEELTNAEVARELHLQEWRPASGTSGLHRLKEILASLRAVLRSSGHERHHFGVRARSGRATAGVVLRGGGGRAAQPRGIRRALPRPGR